jgi:hypothetical protein
MTARLLLAGVAVLLQLPAGEHRHPETGLSMWLPDDWNVDINASSMVGSPSAGDPRFDLIALDGAATLTAATDRAQRLLNSHFRQFETSSPWREIDLNGMRGVEWHGEGVQGAVRKQVRVMVLKSPRSWVLAMWAAGKGRAGRPDETWGRISGGLRPAGAGG